MTRNATLDAGAACAADVDRTNNEAMAHLLAFAEAAESVLRDFGDEYPGRLAPLLDATEAYGIWVTTDSSPKSVTDGSCEASKAGPLGT